MAAGVLDWDSPASDVSQHREQHPPAGPPAARGLMSSDRNSCNSWSSRLCARRKPTPGATHIRALTNPQPSPHACSYVCKDTCKGHALTHTSAYMHVHTHALTHGQFVHVPDARTFARSFLHTQAHIVIPTHTLPFPHTHTRTDIRAPGILAARLASHPGCCAVLSGPRGVMGQGEGSCLAMGTVWGYGLDGAAASPAALGMV